MKNTITLILLLISLSLPAQVTLTITGTTTNDATTGNWNGVQPDLTEPTIFTFSNNSVTSVNTAGYQLLAGDDALSSTNEHNYDNAVISGNMFIYNGAHAYSVDEQAITHGIFIGYQSNVVVKWNYVLRTPMSIIRKANGYTDTGGGVTYNVVKDPYASAIICKGMGGVRIYNNTFYSEQPGYSSPSSGTWRGIVDIYTNSDDGGAAAGVKIKNNIFYTKYQIYNIAIANSADLVGFESDYNIFYCEAGTPYFNYLGTARTFAQWQALGYDAHSQVINPTFASTTTLIPTARLNYGTDLGSTYNTGLATTATWVVNSTPTTATQNGTWQVGAYVFSAGGASLATVTTTAITSITSTTASSGGNVTSDGGATVTARGICWGIWAEPELAYDVCPTSGSGTGAFTSALTGLTPGVTYHVRAYATNSVGTAYGNELIFTATAGGGSANVKYVSTTGSNSNAGTISAPWLTLQYAFNALSAGDTLIVRGGTYLATSTTSNSTFCGVAVNGKHGTAGAHYTVRNYTGETPILDCRNIVGTSYDRAGILLYSADYWYIKGINITRVDQPTGALRGVGLWMAGGNHNVIEGCVSYVNGGPGFEVRTPDGEGNTFINCDAYSNYDSMTSTPGDNADGFDLGFSSSDYTTTLTGCRSWNNGDDGYDCYQYSGYTGKFVFISCWAWHNGYRSDQTTPAGDGCGFKLGADPQSYTGVTKRYMANCLAYNNRTRGFSQESAHVKKEFYNNIAYANGSHGFSFGWTGDASGFEVADVLRNNISWGNTGSAIENLHGGTFYATRISTNNTWDAGVPAVTAADFVSTTSQLTNARSSSGQLPLMTFLHLASTSDLIDIGMIISGLTVDADGNNYSSPPSLGPFEYIVPGGGGGGGEVIPDPTAPIVLTTAVSNIGSVSAMSGGNVTDDGGESVTDRGVCWATHTTPVITDLHAHSGSGTGVFTTSLTGLSKYTTYYVRAFATNSIGTSYGAEVSFRTTNYYIVVW